MNLLIRGERWTVNIASPGDSRLQADDLAVTIPEDKLILLASADATLATIRHELFHAYCSTLYISSTTKLELSDYEEMVCDLVGEWLSEFVKQSGEIVLWTHARATSNA